MNQDNNYSAGNETQGPNLVQPKEKKSLKFIFWLLPFPLILLLFGVTGAFGCAFGGAKFGCRVGLPSLWIGFLVSAVFLSLIAGKVLSNKRIKFSVTIFVISFILPMYLIHLPGTLSYENEMKYLEGYTLESCAKGQPSVLWGAKGNNFTGRCYSMISLVYFYIDGTLRLDKINNIDQCSDVFKDNSEFVNKCKIGIYASKSDWEGCKNLDQGLWSRCFLKVAEEEEIKVSPGDSVKGMTAYVQRKKNNPNACEPFNSIQKDICLYSMTQYTDNIIFCGEMATSSAYINDCIKWAHSH